ncbi:MAG: kelch repeat-containing protein [Gemmataceae bacterium]
MTAIVLLCACIAPLPEAFSSFGAATADGHAYVYGGHAGRTHQYSTESVLGKFRRLKLGGSGGWEELPGGEGLQGLSLVAHGGKLIRVGGMRPRNAPGTRADNVSVTSCAAYDPAAKKWSDLPGLPEPRSSHDAAVIGDRVYVVGGWRMNGQGTESEWQDGGLVLDLAAKEPRWEKLDQPFQRRALQAAAHGGKLYVAGGLNAENEMEKSVDVYDPAAKTWSKVADLPGGAMNGFTPGLCAEGGRLYASPADGVVYRLTAKGDGWERVATLAVPRIVHRIVGAGGKLLALGGAASGGNVRLAEWVSLTGPAAATTWTVKFPGVARQRVGVLPSADGFVAFGGSATFDGEPTAEAFRVRLGDLSVTKLGDLPAAMKGGQAVTAGTARRPKLIALGGPKGAAVAHDGAAWAAQPLNGPAARSLFAATAVGGKVWLTGGLPAGKVLEWSPDGDRVAETVHELPRPRKLHAAALLGDRLVLAGGSGPADEPVAAIDALDVKTGKWEALPPPKAARLMPDLVVLGGKLYLAGGYVTAGGAMRPEPTVEEYDPAAKAWRVTATLPGEGVRRLVGLPHRLLGFSFDTAGTMRLTAIDPGAAPAASASAGDGGVPLPRRGP